MSERVRDRERKREGEGEKKFFFFSPSKIQGGPALWPQARAQGPQQTVSSDKRLFPGVRCGAQALALGVG